MYVNPELGLYIGALTLKARLLVAVPSNMQDTQVYPSMFSRVTNTCPRDAIVSFTLTILWDIEFCHSHSLAIVSDAVSDVLVIFGA